MFASILVAFPAVAAAAEQMSCADYCVDKHGSESEGYVVGTAPMCSGDCVDCEGNFCGPLNADFSDGGKSCWSGSKQCCCTKPDSSNEPPQPKVQSKPLQASAPSCDAFCTDKGIKYGYVRGTAPFCGAGPDDCCPNDFPGMQDSEFEDGGSSCATGSKICCCGTPVGQSECPKPGPDDLSCNIISKVCDVIAEEAIVTLEGCTTLAVEGAVLCETVGLGPENPWADICAAVVGAAIKMGCDKAIEAAEEFGADGCKRAANCDVGEVLSRNKTSSLVV